MPSPMAPGTGPAADAGTGPTAARAAQPRRLPAHPRRLPAHPRRLPARRLPPAHPSRLSAHRRRLPAHPRRLPARRLPPARPRRLPAQPRRLPARHSRPLDPTAPLSPRIRPTRPTAARPPVVGSKPVRSRNLIRAGPDIRQPPAAGPTTSPSTAPASTDTSCWGSPTRTSRASGRTASRSRAMSDERQHGRLVHHHEIVSQPVAAVVGEAARAVGPPAQQAVQGAGVESQQPAAHLLVHSHGRGLVVDRLSQSSRRLPRGRGEGDPRGSGAGRGSLLEQQRQDAGHRRRLAGARPAGDDREPSGERHRSRQRRQIGSVRVGARAASGGSGPEPGGVRVRARAGPSGSRARAATVRSLPPRKQPGQTVTQDPWVDLERGLDRPVGQIRSDLALLAPVPLQVEPAPAQSERPGRTVAVRLARGDEPGPRHGGDPVRRDRPGQGAQVGARVQVAGRRRWRSSPDRRTRARCATALTAKAAPRTAVSSASPSRWARRAATWTSALTRTAASFQALRASGPPIARRGSAHGSWSRSTAPPVPVNLAPGVTPGAHPPARRPGGRRARRPGRPEGPRRTRRKGTRPPPGWPPRTCLAEKVQHAPEVSFGVVAGQAPAEVAMQCDQVQQGLKGIVLGGHGRRQ